jgi:hypothetical protein
MANGTLKPEDEIMYTEISDPVCFTVTDEPYIGCSRPKIVSEGNFATITGANFGPAKGLSYVRMGKKNLAGTDLDPLKTIKVSTAYRLWSNTSIKFKVPKVSATGNWWVQVVVPAATPSKSNLSNKIQVMNIP